MAMMLLLLASAGCQYGIVAADASTARPNIVLVVVDDMGYHNSANPAFFPAAATLLL
eukprot:COSAG01_NODE_20437_length_953_cov_1.367681_1_plen_57_part_00